MFSDSDNMERSFFIQGMQELFSGGEPIKTEIMPNEKAKEKLKNTGSGKVLKAEIITFGNEQKRHKKLVVVKRQRR